MGLRPPRRAGGPAAPGAVVRAAVSGACPRQAPLTPPGATITHDLQTTNGGLENNRNLPLPVPEPESELKCVGTFPPSFNHTSHGI